MCLECFKRSGSPKIINEKTTRLAELIDAIYETDDGGSGGYAHVVVDDWNLEDAFISSCLEEIEVNKYNFSEECCKACKECLLYMKDCSEDERHSAMALHEGFIEAN